MDWLLMTTLMLTSFSVTTEQEKEPVVSVVPSPNGPPTFRRTGALREPNTPFWEPTAVLPNDTAAHVVDGNYPDNHQITTHEHVDQTLGHVPPTKRVKKILPPFEGRLAGDRATERDTSPPPETTPPKENPSDTPTPPELREDIGGIRLVPNDSGLLLADEGSRWDGEEGEAEEVSMQKSIWDLLRERSRFGAESTPDEGVEGNETDVRSRHPKSLYEHFDADSAEEELEMGRLSGGSNIDKHDLPASYAMPWLQAKDKTSAETRPEASTITGHVPQDVSKLLNLSQDDNSVDGVSVSIVGEDYFRYGRRPSKWYLLLLTGNSTIVDLRRKDFAKYLKLNLAARLSLEYDDVKVNKVILAPPKVLVNITVFATSDDVAEESEMDFKVSDKGEALLYKLAETNATLLELSGEEYRVIRFLSFESQKPEAEAHKDTPTTVSIASHQNDFHFIFYALLGSACACAALLTFFLTLTRYYKRVADFPCFKPKHMAWRDHHHGEQDKHHCTQVSPAVIYSGGFPQIWGSWMMGVGQHRAPPTPRHSPPTHSPGLLSPSAPRSYSQPHHRPHRLSTLPTHTKLHMYNCQPNTLLIPIPLQDTPPSSPTQTILPNAGPPIQETAHDNPLFTN